MSKCLKTFYGTGYLKAFIKKKTGGTGYRETFIEKKRVGGGGVRVIEILNYNFLRLKAFIENKET